MNKTNFYLSHCFNYAFNAHSPNIHGQSLPSYAGGLALSVYNRLRLFSAIEGQIVNLRDLTSLVWNAILQPKCGLGINLAKFEKMRVSLEPASSLSLDGLIDSNNLESRADHLKRVFSQKRDFLNKMGAQLAFIPITAPENYLAGFFAREGSVAARPRKNDSFPQVAHENWELAFFVIDIDNRSQVVWMQSGTSVGSPKGILEAFFESLPKGTIYRQYAASVRYMDSERTYWNAIKENKGRITKLTFEFLPPNALGGTDTVKNFVKAAQIQGNPRSQTHTYKSEPGQMNPEADLLAASAEVAMDGGGNASIHAGAETLWTSSKGRTKETIDDDELPTVNDHSFVERVIQRLFEWRKK